jgi:Coenzyme PQQ synthesis protein D (PqqD)
MASQEDLHWRPKARRKGLLVEKVGDEVLVYNLERHRAHCLNGTAARVWKLCTGRFTMEQIASQFDIALDNAQRESVVRDTVSQFQRLGLVEPDEGAVSAVSRRQLVQRIRIGVAAGVVLPLVTSIVAPTPAYATSRNVPNGGACIRSNQCVSGCCCNGGPNDGQCKNTGTCAQSKPCR